MFIIGDTFETYRLLGVIKCPEDVDVEECGKVPNKFKNCWDCIMDKYGLDIKFAEIKGS